MKSRLLIDILCTPKAGKGTVVDIPTTAERKLIGAIRLALKEYDQIAKPDGRRSNGKNVKSRRADPKKLDVGLEYIKEGFSIRSSAEMANISYGALWMAKQRATAAAAAEQCPPTKS